MRNCLFGDADGQDLAMWLRTERLSTWKDENGIEQSSTQILNDFDQAGLSHMCIDSFLADQGYATQRIYHWRSDTAKFREIWPPSPFGLKHHVDLVVNTNHGHSVVMLADGKILDPHFGHVDSLNDPRYSRVYSVAAVWKVREPLG